MPIKPKGEKAKPVKQTTKVQKNSKKFIEASAMPGMTPTNALIVENATNGDPKHGLPGNHAHIVAYNKSKRLREQIELRKQIAVQFCDITPEQVLGATAMRAFASIEGAYDEDGHFSMKLAKESGAIHLIKKLKKTQYGFEAEFYSNETAQQQLANYLGMEFAPKQNEDVASLKAAVESCARAIANERHTDVTHEVRVEAWQRVATWIKQSRARWSQQAQDEMNKIYGHDDGVTHVPNGPAGGGNGHKALTSANGAKKGEG